MNAQEIIDYIANSEKKTPVKVYVNTTGPVDFGTAKVFGGANAQGGSSYVVFGDWKDLSPILEANAAKITDTVVENDRRNSGVPLLDMKGIPARIEPGAIIREKVEIGEGAVIMMGAVINIGAVIGKGTMIDMGTILGGRAMVGDRCHIGAGTVLMPFGGRKQLTPNMAMVAKLPVFGETPTASAMACLCHPRGHRGRRGHRRQRRGHRGRPGGPGRCGGRRRRGH